MPLLARKLRNRLTWGNARWFARATVLSWLLQGALVGLLAVLGVGTLAAVVSAKATAYVVFLGQCVTAARAN